MASILKLDEVNQKKKPATTQDLLEANYKYLILKRRLPGSLFRQNKLFKYFSALNKISSYFSNLHSSVISPINTSPISEEFAFYNLLYRNFDLTHLEEPKISGLEEEKDSSYSVGETQIPRIITDIYNNHSLFDKVEPQEFEEIIAELLRSQGYQVELTKRTRDGGYDIIALATLKGNIPFKMLVECKRYKDKVGVGIIRGFKEVVMSSNANKGLIATTGLFTSGAWKKREQAPYLLDFRDKDAIIEWVEGYVESRNKKTEIVYLS